MTPRFGQPDAIRAEVVARLPAAMKAEAVLMLLDMGEHPAAVCRRLALSRDAVAALLRAAPQHQRYEEPAGPAPKGEKP